MNSIIQEILAYSVILVSALITIYKSIAFSIPAKSTNKCSSCASGSCSIGHEIKSI